MFVWYLLPYLHEKYTAMEISPFLIRSLLNWTEIFLFPVLRNPVF